MFSNQKGSTMLETIGAMMVVSMVSIGIISLIGKMFSAFKQNMVENEIKEIQKNITDRYRADGNYANLKGISAEDAYKEKLIPTKMFADGGIMHSQNGDVEITVVDGAEDYFNITFRELTRRSCIELSQLMWNSTQSTDLYAITINKENSFIVPLKSNGIKSGDENALPVTVKKAVDSCNEKDGENMITWMFY